MWLVWSCSWLMRSMALVLARRGEMGTAVQGRGILSGQWLTELSSHARGVLVELALCPHIYLKRYLEPRRES